MLKNSRFLTAAAGHTGLKQRSARRAVQQMDPMVKRFCKFAFFQQMSFILSAMRD
jgi:hypothetical protein